MHLVLCNAPPDSADGIARSLVEERLAACVNLSPVRSVYRWQGAIESDAETTLFIKVSSARLPALRARLLALHPYELPEVLVFDVNDGASHQGYVAWVEGECAPQSGTV